MLPRGAGRSHVIDFKIVGEELQFVEVELDPGETVVAEAGAMTYMTQGIDMETKFGDGSGADEGGGFLGKALSAGKRMLTGESLSMTHFTAHAPGKSHVAFAAPYAGRIVPFDLSALGGEILCERDAFLCAAKGTEVGIAFNKRFGAGLFGGEGLFLATLSGPGKIWLQSLPFSRLARRVVAAAAPAANEGEGGILNVAGGLDTLLGGGDS